MTFFVEGVVGFYFEVMHEPKTTGSAGAEIGRGPQQMVNALLAWASCNVTTKPNMCNGVRGRAGAATARGALAQAATQRRLHCEPEQRKNTSGVA